MIASVLHNRGYSLQANKKSLNEKKQDPQKRDKQFKYITRLGKGFIQSGHPVISMDTKKKESTREILRTTAKNIVQKGVQGSLMTMILAKRKPFPMEFTI